jgi:hypothetical protein
MLNLQTTVSFFEYLEVYSVLVILDGGTFQIGRFSANLLLIFGNTSPPSVSDQASYVLLGGLELRAAQQAIFAGEMTWISA